MAVAPRLLEVLEQHKNMRQAVQCVHGTGRLFADRIGAPEGLQLVKYLDPIHLEQI